MKPLLWAILMSSAVVAARSATDDVTLTPLSDRVRIEIGGKFFSEYVFRGAPRPYLHPIVDADGTRYTRAFPMEDREGEEKDHVNHRSVWFAHGDVNGHDFWRERAGTGSIVHEALVETRSGAVGTIRASNRWVAASGAQVCTDDTTIHVRRAPDARGYLIDWEVTLHASHGELVLGDTEEGCMGVRVNEQLRVVHGRGPQRRAGTGTIVTSAGKRNGEAWGTRGAWCHYSGKVADELIGVAIFDHPSNPRHPTWWHVREYGLMAANFLGRHDFEKLSDARAGEMRIAAHERLALRYRLYFHRGVNAEKLPAYYEQYASTGVDSSGGK